MGESEAQIVVPRPGRAARAAHVSRHTIHRMHLASRRPANWLELLKFAVVGASGYAVNLIVFGLLTQLGDVHHLLAAVGAFCVAVTNNFVLNRGWTFGASEGHAGFQAARFFAVSLVGLGFNLILLAGLVAAGLPELPAQALAVALSTPINFVGNKLWTFG